MTIFVPEGDETDWIRRPAYYEDTNTYLRSLAIAELTLIVEEACQLLVGSRLTYSARSEIARAKLLLISVATVPNLAACYSAPNPVSPTSTRDPSESAVPTDVAATLPIPASTSTEEPATAEGCVIVRSLNVRSGPGTEHPVIAGARDGDCYNFNGRSPDGEWARGFLSQPRGFSMGWMAVEFIVWQGDVSVLPELGSPPTVAAPGPPPTITRWPTATSVWPSPTITRWSTATTGAITPAPRSAK